MKRSPGDLDYLWCEQPEYKETWCAKSKSSFLEAEFAISLSRRDLSVKPARQYLNMVVSDIGFPVLEVLLGAEFLASMLSESDEELSSSKLSGSTVEHVMRASST